MGQKKKITIEVDPQETVVTIGLLKGFLPGIVEQLNLQMKGKGMQLNNRDSMMEVLEEIYEKCIAETDIREVAQAMMNHNPESGPAN